MRSPRRPLPRILCSFHRALRGGGSKENSARLRQATAAAALAFCLLAPACASSLGNDVPGNTVRVQVPTPAPGKANVALLRFYLTPGKVPDLRITNGFRQPSTAAFVGGIAPVGAGNSRFVGLVAIVNFQNPAAPAVHRGTAAIEASQPFFVDYLGDMQSVGSRASAIQAILTGIPGPEAWTVDWFNQPQVATVAARSFSVDGRSLLDATFRRLLARPNADYVEAIAGPSPTPAKKTPLAAQQSSGRPKAGATPTAPTGTAAKETTRTPATPGRSGGGPAGTQPASGALPATAGSGGPTQPGATPAPGSSSGPVPLSTEVVSASTNGPYAPGTQVVATSVCPGGSTLVGGGFNLHTVTGVNPNNSFRDMGEFPSATDGSAVGSGSAQAYATLGGAGGQAMTDSITSNYAVCAHGWPAAVEVVVSTVFGPGGPATSQGVTVSCPAGTTMIGGGARTTIPPPPAPSQPSLHLIGDYPSDPTGTSPASGSSVNSWTAVADAGGTNVTNATTSAFVMCAEGGPATQVIATVVPGPEVASTPTVAVAMCPTGTVLLGGGVRADTPGGGTPQQGIHLTGSYPGQAPTPVASGPAGQSWSGVAHSGGQSASRTETWSFAICTKP
jgi:hypothetical protein